MTSTLPPPYPLAWPPGRPRTLPSQRLPGRYNAANVPQAMTSLHREVERWRKIGREQRIVSDELTSDLSVRSRAEPPDPGAAFWFTLSGPDLTRGASMMVLSCDRFDKLHQNIRAISLTMERLRLVDEIGAYSLIAAVEGAKALPPPSSIPGVVGTPDDPWYRVLQVSPDAPLAVAQAAYRALALKAGEGSSQLRQLNLAIDQARRMLRE